MELYLCPGALETHTHTQNNTAVTRKQQHCQFIIGFLNLQYHKNQKTDIHRKKTSQTVLV